jgi:hypothetical protein
VIGSEEFASITWGQWTKQQADYLLRGIPVAAWLLAGSGYLSLVTRRSEVEDGESSLKSVASVFLIAAALYFVVWRGASYRHSYAGFYFVVPVAVLGGLALNSLMDIAGNGAGSRLFRGLAVALGVVIMSILGYKAFGNLRYYHRIQFLVIEGARKEPSNFIPEFGRKIQSSFAESTRVLCNFH